MIILPDIFLNKLRLSNYRNYSAASFSTDSKINIITGKNGAGKTNILEAISFLSPGRGLRSAKLADINHKSGKLPWAIASELMIRDYTHKIGTGINPDNFEGRRIVKIDGSKQKGGNILADYTKIVWLTPSMQDMIFSSSYERRKFLDRIAYNLDPEHARLTAIYEGAMRERMKLLKDGINDDIWLRTLEARMAETGISIAANRNETVLRLVEEIEGTDTSFPKARLTIKGEVEEKLQKQAAIDIEDHFKSQLKSYRMQDRDNSRSNFGVHKSDLEIYHKSKNMHGKFCSTGEQKALLIGLTLAQSKMIERLSGIAPILLLDEITTHLDDTRKNEALELVAAGNNQCFLTGTEESLFAALLTKANCYKVSSNKITSG